MIQFLHDFEILMLTTEKTVTLLYFSLGVGHDVDSDTKGLPYSCSDFVNIMSTTHALGPSAFQWSKCSSKTIYDELTE